MRPAAALVLLSVSGAGCAYYNGMWSANRLARDARRYEAAGQVAQAKITWAQAAVKAESVLVHHPRSRWGPAALVLEGEGKARSGACNAAVPVLARAIDSLSDRGLVERAELAGGMCALALQDLERADRWVTPVLRSSDRRRRSQAALLAGQAAMARGDAVAAADMLGRSEESAAAPARARALIAAGRFDDALSSLDIAKVDRFSEDDWTPLFGELAAEAGPSVADRGLQRFLASGRTPVGARARLLLADGDRLREADELDSAAARYATVVRLARDSSEGGRAQVRQLQIQMSRARTLADLAAPRAELERLADGNLGGIASQEVTAVMGVVARIERPDSTETGLFRAAELARDSLRAGSLAANLLLQFAREHPRSLFAPKAIVAAMPFRAAVADSLVALLDSGYAASPYTLALHGELSPAYGAAEDSMAVALGLSTIRLSGSTDRFAAPSTGPRGPLLDPADEVGLAPPAARRALPARTPVRRAQRPGDRPTPPAGRPDEQP